MEIKINTEELRKRKLFIATPMYGGNCNGLYMKSCLDVQSLCARYGIEMRFSFLFNESLITRARNYLADEFLRSGYTHMLFLDSDIYFNPEDVLAMLALADDKNDMDIIGAPYPKKSINWNNVAKAVTKNAKNPKFEPGMLEGVVGDYVFSPVPGTTKFKVTEPLEVLETGTGFMMIKRRVFDKYREEYPHLAYKPDHHGQANFDGSRMIHCYFDAAIDPKSQRYLSEDYFFCQNWRNIGGKVFLCPWMKTQHIGTYAFTGDMPRIADLTGDL